MYICGRLCLYAIDELLRLKVHCAGVGSITADKQVLACPPHVIKNHTFQGFETKPASCAVSILAPSVTGKQSMPTNKLTDNGFFRMLGTPLSRLRWRSMDFFLMDILNCIKLVCRKVVTIYFPSGACLAMLVSFSGVSPVFLQQRLLFVRPNFQLITASIPSCKLSMILIVIGITVRRLSQKLTSLHQSSELLFYNFPTAVANFYYIQPNPASVLEKWALDELNPSLSKILLQLQNLSAGLLARPGLKKLMIDQEAGSQGEMKDVRDGFFLCNFSARNGKEF
ncbi:hypothetical protein CPB83DRAFT_840931 [Crepidotus variabilis]|uniref:Uncharacterized protein n=1 Tax=Crepidotus variabilis TaxID=179855 RepID=A0A9P6JHZ6_9AGAR|nr:hypothetical protein CPB83DRAFT_840931 [Crepidotus variabilis]